MRIAGTVQDSIVDGPGLRFTVFAQGCPRHCEGCHNPQTIDPCGGEEVPVDAVIRNLLKNPLTDGLTLSGGEPFLQAKDCAAIARAAHGSGLNVWAYTGYLFEELLEKSLTDPEIEEFLREIDVLIDGPFLKNERSLDLRFRGSRNQRILDITRSIAAGAAVEREKIL